MAVDIMKGLRMPDGTTIELHDYERGQPNGVATLDANGKVEQDWNNLIYATQIPAPAPYEDTYNLMEWTYLVLTGAI